MITAILKILKSGESVFIKKHRFVVKLALIVLGIFMVVITAVVYGMFKLTSMSTKESSNITKVSIGNTTIQAEIADTLPKQIRGLMFRKSLPSDSGMLFVFGHDDYYGIWMMNMSMPIDIIWVDSGHKVVDIMKSAPPCKIICPAYRPSGLARYVLEVNSGFADNHGINVDDSVDFALTSQ